MLIGKKKRRVIVHIGMHKTGTTSAQQTFGANRKLLAESDVYYPQVRPFNHSANFPPVIMEDPTQFVIFGQRGITQYADVIAERDRLKEAWIKEFKACKKRNFIISGEELSKLSEQDVGNLKAFLEPYFDEISIIIYVREPASFIPSVISEFVKHGGRQIHFDNYSKRFPLYQSRIEPFRKWFDSEQITIRAFDKKILKKGDLFEDFFDAFGIAFDCSQLKRINANPSLSHDTVMFLLMYNRKFHRYKKGKINLERGLPFRLDVFYNTVICVKGDKFRMDLRLSEEDAEVINREIVYVNQFLPEEAQFAAVEAASGDLEEIDPQSEISEGYYTSLVNEFSKKIDSLIDERDSLKETIAKR